MKNKKQLLLAAAVAAATIGVSAAAGPAQRGATNPADASLRTGKYGIGTGTGPIVGVDPIKLTPHLPDDVDPFNPFPGVP